MKMSGPALTPENRARWILRCSRNLAHRERVGNDAEAVPARLMRHLVARDHVCDALDVALSGAIDALDDLLVAVAADGWGSDEPAVERAQRALDSARATLGSADRLQVTP